MLAKGRSARLCNKYKHLGTDLAKCKESYFVVYEIMRHNHLK
jgi:hypothetical protein